MHEPKADEPAESDLDPSIPLRSGEVRATHDLVAQAGTGRSGPDDVGTGVHDLDEPIEAQIGDPGPTARLWRDAEAPEQERPVDTSTPEVELPTPPDNPGGPPPGAPRR